MAKFDKTNHKTKNSKVPSSLDQALLNEFFSIIASVAVRLTKTDVRAKNADDSTKQEVSKL